MRNSGGTALPRRNNQTIAGGRFGEQYAGVCRVWLDLLSQLINEYSEVLNFIAIARPQTARPGLKRDNEEA